MTAAAVAFVVCGTLSGWVGGYLIGWCAGDLSFRRAIGEDPKPAPDPIVPGMEYELPDGTVVQVVGVYPTLDRVQYVVNSRVLYLPIADARLALHPHRPVSWVRP